MPSTNAAASRAPSTNGILKSDRVNACPNGTIRPPYTAGNAGTTCAPLPSRFGPSKTVSVSIPCKLPMTISAFDSVTSGATPPALACASASIFWSPWVQCAPPPVAWPCAVLKHLTGLDAPSWSMYTPSAPYSCTSSATMPAYLRCQ